MKDKLLFTTVNQIPGAFLLSSNRLTAAEFFSGEKNIKDGIYVARVKDSVKDLNACFVEIEKGLTCYLPASECKEAFLLNRKLSGEITPARLHSGDLLAVQVIREAQKTKHPTVTTGISVASPYFVLTLGPARTGYSTKLPPDEKKRLRRILIDIPEYFDAAGNMIGTDPALPSFGVVVRTECAGQSEEDLRKDLRNLLSEFQTLLKLAPYRKEFTCLRSPGTAWERALDALTGLSSIEEIVTDDPELFDQLKHRFADPSRMQLRLYEDASYSLEKLYGLATGLKEALSVRIWLKSGAYLIIEATEALTVIDVNSGKYEAKKGNREFFRSINLEAAKEIARQIRLRNLSGMIVVDFINLESEQDQSDLLKAMTEFVKSDRIRTNVIDFTKLGLMELTRAKKSPTLAEQAKNAGLVFPEVYH